MPKTFTFYAAAAALTAALGLPAWSAIGPGGPSMPSSVTAAPAPLTVADNESDSESDGARAGKHDDDDDDECEDDGGRCGAASNPAPAGAAPPPQNGLFGSGAAPQVQVN